MSLFEVVFGDAVAVLLVLGPQLLVELAQEVLVEVDVELLVGQAVAQPSILAALTTN